MGARFAQEVHQVAKIERGGRLPARPPAPAPARTRATALAHAHETGVSVPGWCLTPPGIGRSPWANHRPTLGQGACPVTKRDRGIEGWGAHDTPSAAIPLSITHPRGAGHDRGAILATTPLTPGTGSATVHPSATPEANRGVPKGTCPRNPAAARMVAGTDPRYGDGGRARTGGKAVIRCRRGAVGTRQVCKLRPRIGGSPRDRAHTYTRGISTYAASMSQPCPH